MSATLLVRKDSYHDSVLLMRLSQSLKRVEGVEDAIVAMGTPVNRELLSAQGWAGAELSAAGPNDLVIAIKGGPGAPAAVEAELERLLRAGRPRGGEEEQRPASLAAALAARPESNLALISVPGAYAAREARRALARGLHVMLFSDNVPLADEIALKRDAIARGLLMMGPDCGTAILDGRPLGFANAVRRGPIGIVGAAGTGIQEVSSLIHRHGCGVSQAIGTGGRDLSADVGGLMTRFGIEALAADPGTQVIVVISKPPAESVAREVIAALAATPKPCVLHFVGSETRAADPRRGIVFSDSLADAAESACRQSGMAGAPRAWAGPDPTRVAQLAARLPRATALRGLFCGGTTGQEALAILGRSRLEVRSNLHKSGPLRIDGLAPVPGHALLDLGDDLFTRGRPHPMIEPVLRNERLAVEMEGDDARLLLFDCVLGYGAHPDPAGVLVEGVARARSLAGSRPVVAIASVTGTPDDPQDSHAQTRRLEEAGLFVEPDNRAAASLAAAVLERALRAPAVPGGAR